MALYRPSFMLHQRHPSFGPAASLFKRWLCSHLLAPHVPPPAAELLVARVYVHTHPHGAPTQPQLGLARALRALGDTDWGTEMLVLDFNGDMKREEILELESKFASRDASAPYMHIVTSYDGALPGVWTAPLLRQTVLRAQALARNTLKYLEDSLVGGMLDNVLSAFVPSYAGYDVLIHLRASLCPYRCERVDARPERRAVPSAGDVIPVVGFNPVQKYLDELQSAFSDFALFFHDTYGGQVIAVLWKPDINSDKEFQVSNASALRPIPGDSKYRVDTAAILEDFKLMGTGLVSHVTVNT